MALSQKAKRFQQHRVTLLFDKPCCAQDAHRHSWCFPLSVRVLTKVDPDAPDMDFLSGCACRNQPLDHVLGKDYEGVTKIEKRSEALEPSAVPQTGARVHPVEGRYEWHISLPPEGGESCPGHSEMSMHHIGGEGRWLIGRKRRADLTPPCPKE